MAKRRVPEVVTRRVPRVSAPVVIGRASAPPTPNSRAQLGDKRPKPQVSVPARLSSRTPPDVSAPPATVRSKSVAAPVTATQNQRTKREVANPQTSRARSKRGVEAPQQQVRRGKSTVEAPAATPRSKNRAVEVTSPATNRAKRTPDAAQSTAAAGRAGRSDAEGVNPRAAIGLNKPEIKGGILTFSEV